MRASPQWKDLIDAAKGRKPRVRRAADMRPKEASLHIAVADVLRERCLPYWTWFHVPNGEYRGARLGAKLKEMGVKPGIPDLILIAPDNTNRFLELKREGEKLNEAQREFQTMCIARGYPHAVAYSVDEAIAILEEWACLRISITKREPA